MQAQLFQKLRTAFSPDRLDAYRQTSDSDFDVICKYLWNIALCESFYPALQTLEIALRNTLHASTARRFGKEAWFDSPGGLALDHQGIMSISHAKSELLKVGKPLEPRPSFQNWLLAFGQAF